MTHSVIHHDTLRYRVVNRCVTTGAPPGLPVAPPGRHRAVCDRGNGARELACGRAGGRRVRPARHVRRAVESADAALSALQSGRMIPDAIKERLWRVYVDEIGRCRG